MSLIYTKEAKYLPIKVYINDSLISKIEKPFTEKPDCMTKGAVTIELPSGLYYFKAEGANGAKWPRIVLDFDGECIDHELL